MTKTSDATSFHSINAVDLATITGGSKKDEEIRAAINANHKHGKQGNSYGSGNKATK